jgi:D-alanine-D-alanine ligase
MHQLLENHVFAEADVLVVYGGESAEREVSLRTGAAVLGALQRSGFRARGIDLVRGRVRELVDHLPEVVMIAMHGFPGEDGTLQGLLEFLQVPYTGSGVLASALAMDKVRTKHVLRSLNVPTPAWGIARPGDLAPPKPPGFPCVVKPSLEGSSVGVSIVDDASKWDAALAACSTGRGEVLCEALIRGRELTVAVFDAEVLGLIEIVAADGVYDYEAKYQRGDTRYVVPTDLTVDVHTAILRAAKDAYDAVGCRGIARVDVMLDAGGRPWVLEVNTIPGMTATSLVPKIAAARGMSFEQLVSASLAAATTDAAR